VRVAVIVVRAELGDSILSKLRLRYKKIGRARYISHLDLSSTMQRAITRAGIELTYSQGFNPHPYMSVALPLPVGAQSICELIDVGISQDVQMDKLPEQITACLPEGLEITDAYVPERKFSEIAWLEVKGIMYYDEGVSDAVTDRLTERFSAERIEISKKTKSGESIIDISEHIRDLRFSQSELGDVIEFSARLSAQNPTIGPKNLMDALKGEYAELFPDFVNFTRVEVFDKDMNFFK